MKSRFMKFLNGLKNGFKFVFHSTLYPLPSTLYPFFCRKGQTTVEYLLMLAVVVGMALTLGIIFYKHILGLFYTMVGMVLGAGEPT